jgi:hypothetical protein
VAGSTVPTAQKDLNHGSGRKFATERSGQDKDQCGPTHHDSQFHGAASACCQRLDGIFYKRAF